MGFLYSLRAVLVSCRWSVGIYFTVDVQFRKKTGYEQHSDDWHFCWVVCGIHYRSYSHTWRSLIVKKWSIEFIVSNATPCHHTICSDNDGNNSCEQLTSLSSGLLLINNNTIKLAKNISSNEPNLSHKFGNGGLGCAAAAGNNNNNIKSINDASTKKLKAG